jgi:hypothetical protein
MRTADTVERPHLGWWLATCGGLGFTALLGFDAGVYAFWRDHVTAIVPQRGWAVVFVGSYVIHLGEALYARARARRAGLVASANGWAVQTFLLGFPSLRLLLARTRS